MNRNTIAALLFKAHKNKSYFVNFRGESYTIDELLSMLTGHEVEYPEAVEFFNHSHA